MHFAGGMLVPSIIRAGTAGVFPGFVFFPMAIDEGLLETFE